MGNSSAAVIGKSKDLNLDCALTGTVQNPDALRELPSQDRALFQKEVSANYSQLSTQSAVQVRPPVSEDPRVLVLEEEQAKLRRKIQQAENNTKGSEKYIQQLEQDAVAAESWFSFRTDGPVIRERIKTERELREAQIRREAELEQRLEQSQKALEDFKRLEEEGRRLEAAGDIAGAQDAYNRAQLAFQAAQVSDAEMSSIDKSATYTYLDKSRKLNDQHLAAIQTMENREEYARIARDVIVITGATIATGGAAAAVGGVVGVGAGLAAGTGFGLVAGAASTSAEAVGHIGYGNKSVSKAFSDAAADTARITKDAAIASAASIAAGGVAARAAGQVATSILSNHRVTGSLAGGAASVVSDVSQTTIAIASGAESRSWGKIASDTAKNAGIGLVSGAIGAHAGALKHGQSLVRVAAVTAGQVTAEAAVGVGAEFAQATLEGRSFTSIDAMHAAGHALWTGAVGEMVSTAASRATPLGKPNSAEAMQERSLVERGLALSTEAEMYVAQKAQGIGDDVAAHIDQHRETVEIAAERAADATARDVADQVRKHGSDVLTEATVEESARVNTKRETLELHKELKTEAEVRERVLSMLQETRRKSVGEIKTEIEEAGIAEGRKAKRVAKEIKASLETGHKDGHMKDVLTEHITDRVTRKLESIMEGPWRNRFKSLLRGEVDSADSEVLGSAARERAAKLGKSFDEFTDDLTNAGWRGARRGIREATQEVVRRGVEDAFKMFRSQVAGYNNERADRKRTGTGGEEAEVRAARLDEDNSPKRADEQAIRHTQDIPRYSTLVTEGNHQFRNTYEFRAGRWELVQRSDLGEVLAAQQAERQNLEDRFENKEKRSAA